MKLRAIGVLALLTVGCTAKPHARELDPTAEADVDDAPIPFLPWSSTEPEPEPTTTNGGPRVVVERNRESPGPCWDVWVEGLPAVAEDGTVAVTEAQGLQLSAIPGWLSLQLVSPDGGVQTFELVRAAEGTIDLEGDRTSEGTERCRAEFETLQTRAAAVNEVPRESRWRSVEPLPVEKFDPEAFAYSTELETKYTDHVPVEDRPVQILARNGMLVARVAGVRVLERMRGPRGMLVRAVHADRDSGAVAVLMATCGGASCTCDPRHAFAVGRWSAEAFEMIDRRPCVEDPADDRLRCDYNLTEELDLFSPFGLRGG